jgi:hypothetical protein
MNPSSTFFSDNDVEYFVYGNKKTLAEKIAANEQAILLKGIKFAAEFLIQPVKFHLKSVSVHEPNEMGEEFKFCCIYESEHIDALFGDLTADFAFACHEAEWSNWEILPRCRRFSIRVT